jgi:hypothetical protein
MLIACAAHAAISINPGRSCKEEKAMTKTIGAPANKSLVFHFHGGPDSGTSLRLDRPHPADGAACLLWASTRMGTVGQRFNWFTDGQRHRYKVTDKKETPDTIIVVCEHVEGDETTLTTSRESDYL